MADGIPTPETGAAATGATLHAQYMGRTMKCYPVHETEMDSLASMNTQATAFFSAASAFAAYAVGIWTNASFADKLTATAEVASMMVGPILIVVAFFFAGLGIYTVARRRSLWKKIKSEAVTLHATAA
jgi:hypothetical protein